jgi:hypothetical protein
MRSALLCVVAVAALLTACSRKPADEPKTDTPAAAPPAAAAAVTPGAASLSGAFTANGKAAALTQVSAAVGDPESGQPITLLVFTEKDQAGDSKAGFNALFNKYGDAIVAKLHPDGSVYSVDLIHSALQSPSGSATVFGVFTTRDYKNAGGEVSGELTSGGTVDVQGQKVDVDLIFHTKAP